MAAFGLERIPVREIGKEWSGKYLPLYLGALFAGVGIAVGIAVLPNEQGAARPAASANVAAPASALIARELPQMLVFTPRSNVASWTIADDTAALLPLLGEPLPAPAPVAAAEAPAAAAPVAPIAKPAAAAPVAKPAQPAAPPQAAQPAEPAPEPAAPPAAAGKPNFYVPAVSSGPATDLENRLLAGINAERAKEGLPALSGDSSLVTVARTRSQQMVDQGYFGHRDPYGYSMYVELLAHFGIGYGWAGENLAMNNYGVHESPEKALAALMASPSHRANIMADDFFRVGVGAVKHADGRIFYTMIFVG